MATNTRELMQYKLNGSDYDSVKVVTVVCWFTFRILHCKLSTVWSRNAQPFVCCRQLWQHLVCVRLTCNWIHRIKIREVYK
jgi:hypothetical protein